MLRGRRHGRLLQRGVHREGRRNPRVIPRKSSNDEDQTREQGSSRAAETRSGRQRCAVKSLLPRGYDYRACKTSSLTTLRGSAVCPARTAVSIQSFACLRALTRMLQQQWSRPQIAQLTTAAPRFSAERNCIATFACCASRMQNVLL